MDYNAHAQFTFEAEPDSGALEFVWNFVADSRPHPLRRDDQPPRRRRAARVAQVQVGARPAQPGPRRQPVQVSHALALPLPPELFELESILGISVSAEVLTDKILATLVLLLTIIGLAP
jgi:hypothetical protein